MSEQIRVRYRLGLLPTDITRITNMMLADSIMCQDEIERKRELVQELRRALAKIALNRLGLWP